MPMHHLKNHGAGAEKEEICLFAQTNFRNQMRRFGIKTDDRRRHMYVIGKTGMGKTTMMENMVLSDIYAGHGVGVVDPHGDFAEKIINYIPPNRINDVVYFNPADLEYPIGFNILEVKSEEQKHLVAAGLMATFKKIWPDVWSSRMEYILNNTLLALLDYPGSTLLGINRLLADKIYRKKVIGKLKDPVVKAFWQTEFANYPDRYMTEAVAPIQNKIGQFLSASVIRNMVAQVKSTIDTREIMDSKKILIMNLSKGRIGEDNSRLLGGMLITEIQLAAMARVDMPEKDRQDFFLYVDEFQNFATPSFANILSEARKYRLSLIMAHQYVAQLDEVVADAVFGNVGTIVTFRIGGADAEALEKEFEPTFMATDIVNLAKYQTFLKLMIDGVASQPFSAMTLPPIGSPTGSAEKVIKVSRERYGKRRDVIEDKILRWSGMGELDEDEDGEENSEGENGVTKIEPKSSENLISEKTGSSEPEKTVSLSDLLPKNIDQDQKIKKIEEPQIVDSRQPSSRAQAEGQTADSNKQRFVNNTGVNVAGGTNNNQSTSLVSKQVEEKISRWKDNGLLTGEDANKVKQQVNQPASVNQSHNLTTEQEFKKKKRKRKKKNKGAVQNSLSPSAVPVINSRPQTADESLPKSIKPDQVITFGTTDDDGYDTDRAER